MKKLLHLLCITYVFASTAMEPALKKQRVAESLQDIFAFDREVDQEQPIDEEIMDFADKEMFASDLVDLYQNAPGDVQRLVASYLYKSSNIEAFLTRNGMSMPFVTRNVHVYNTSQFNKAADKILVADLHGAVTLVSLENGECLQTFKGHLREVDSVVFNSAEDKILTASRDGSVKIWSVETGICLHTFQEDAGWPAVSAVFSEGEDKVFVVFGSGLLDFSLRICSVESGEWLETSAVPIPTFGGPSMKARNGGILFNGRDRVLTDPRDGLKLWSVETGECLQTFVGHTSRMYDAMLSTAGDKLLTASFDGSAKLWSVMNGECLQTFNHGTSLHKVLFNNNEDMIVTISKRHNQESSKLWSVESGECLETLCRGECINEVAFSREGNKVVTVHLVPYGIVKIWDIHFWDRFKRSLTLRQVQLLAEIRQVAKHRLWLKLKEKESDAVLTHDGKKVTEEQLVVDFTTDRYKDLKEGYEDFPPFIQDACEDYVKLS